MFNGDDRYLFVSVNGDEEIDPPTLLTSAPGAAVSKRVVGDIRTAPGILQIPSPDDCAPPEPCEPAIELKATAESNSLKVLSPPQAGGDPQPQIHVVCGETAEVQFCSEDGKLAGLGVNAASNESYLELGSTSIDGSGPSMIMTTLG